MVPNQSSQEFNAFDWDINIDLKKKKSTIVTVNSNDQRSS